MIPLQCKQSTRVSRDYFKMRFDLSERIIWAGPNTMIYFHYTWKKNNYCRIHHLWIRQSVLNVDNVIVIAALLYNNLAMTSPYWCPPSRLCLLPVEVTVTEQWAMRLIFWGCLTSFFFFFFWISTLVNPFLGNFCSINNKFGWLWLNDVYLRL